MPVRSLVALVVLATPAAAADPPVNFARDVEPVLTKAGCNSGGCHGAQHGRGGFRLSLFAFDPAFDYDQIVRSNEGRRVVLHDPEQRRRFSLDDERPEREDE